ncbi:MAG: tetratricopeptide repeat protein [Burkholderiales bacterium]|nr:tetratricopeptide repeat protein [Burkholderiales bacterium]
MAFYDLEEQESLAQIKAWWDKWGTLVLSIATAVCLAIAGFRLWQWWEMKQAADAGGLYAMMIQASNGKDNARVQNIAQRLYSDYGSTVYAGMGALLAAYSAENTNQPQEAIKNLEWVYNGDKFPELQAVSAVRLAGIYLDQNNYDKALSVLNGVLNPDTQEALVDDRKGDVYMAMGDTQKAREAWESALRAATITNPIVNLIRIKLEALPPA